MQKLTLNKIINSLIILFFSLSVYLPKSYSELKLVLLAFLCFIAILSLFRHKIYLKKNIIIWYFLFILYYLIWIGISFLKGNNLEGLIDMFRLYVIYPIIFLLFTIILSNSRKKIYLLFKVIIFSNFLIAINTILLFTNELNLTNLNFLYELTASAGGAVHEGYTKVGADNLNSLFFTFPFLLTYYRKNDSSSKTKVFLLVIIVLTIFAILISGRRMIQIIMVLSIIINYFAIYTNRDIKIKHLLGLLFAVFIGVAVTYLGPNWSIKYLSVEMFFQRIDEAFLANSANVRYLQIVELFRAFLDKPIIGSGFGKGIDSVVRSSEKPWAYEVTHVLRLYQTGIIGILMYISLLYYNIHLALNMIKKYRDDIYVMPLLFGYVSFLLGLFSNPLFGNFDFMWVMFIIPIYYSYLEIQLRSNKCI